MLYTIVGLSFLAGALGALSVMGPALDPAVARRLRELRRHSPGDPVDEDLALPFSQRVVRPALDTALRSLAALLPRAMQDRARQRLLQAGVALDPARFVGIQLTLAAAGALAGLLVGLPSLLARQWLLPAVQAGALAAAGWRLPLAWLERRVQARRRALERSLPDVMDLLAVSVEAGLGFDGAVQKVAEKFQEPVAGEFREYLKQVRLGRPRADALRALAERSGSPDLQTFAAAVIQADQLGVSLVKVLTAQADALRVRRRQRAEERAMQLPLKLLFPLIVFIFPTLFIVILGPVAIALLTSFRP